jgi:uncharacterized membrane protein
VWEAGAIDAIDRWDGSGSIRLAGFASDLHPMVVHFPVALLLTGLVFELVAAVRGSPALARTALMLLVLGFVGALAAVATGLASPEVRAVQRALEATPANQPGVRDLYLARLARIRVHQRLGYGVLATAAVVLLVRLWRSQGRWWAAASAVSGVALLVVVVAAGLAGGRLAR